MEYFVYLLNKASFYLYMTKAEKKAFNSSPSVNAMFDDLRGKVNELRDYNKISIGEEFAQEALRGWNDHKAESINRITEYIATGNVMEPRFIIGLISLWVNSEIQHPIVEELVKHSLKNDLLKLPLSTTVNEYNSIKYKKPNHAPKSSPFLWVETLMTYFEIKTISGTSKNLGIDRKSVKEHLSKIVKGEVEYKVLIDENFEHYKLIQKTYYRWLAYKKDIEP